MKSTKIVGILMKWIKHYKDDNIVEKKEISIKAVKTIKTINSHIETITGHPSWVTSFFLLKDGRVESFSDDKIIRIYEPSNDFNCIERHLDDLSSIYQLDDGTIVSCSVDGEIMIGDYNIKYAHDNSIPKVIALTNNRIATSSTDNSIKIWRSNPPYSKIPIKVIKGHNWNGTSLLYIKERNIMISCPYDKSLRLWNMSSYQCTTIIAGVNYIWTNSLYQIDSDRVIVGEFDSFCIVNIDKLLIEKRIRDH